MSEGTFDLQEKEWEFVAFNQLDCKMISIIDFNSETEFLEKCKKFSKVCNKGQLS